MTGDPSDVCARCGHDRDDHAPGCAWPGCDCPLFVEEVA